MSLGIGVGRARERLRTSAHDIWGRLRHLPAARWLEVSLLSAIFAYGSLLRFEAFQRDYGPLLGSSWWVRLQGGVADLVQLIRPASLAWPPGSLPYRFDAKSYVGEARAMAHFYEARLREPLFVFATKVGQWLTGDQDIAVSMMSSIFSSLIILATYALGRAIGGAAVGLLGALFIAIERDMIWTGTAGYRDDLFALLTVLFAYCCVCLYRRPSIRRAVVTGIVAGLACLTRVTALSFVLPGLLAVTFSHGFRDVREMLQPAVASGLIAVTLLAPFLVTCWIEYGDPFYSINAHSRFYRQRSGMDVTEPMNAGSFLALRLSDEPAQTLHTALRGITIYPWANKWSGYAGYWGRPFASALKWLCVAGVLMWLWVPEGRLALLVFAASMLPYAFTWEIRGGAQWRMTMHAYTFFLPAAAYAIVETMRWARRLATTKAARRPEIQQLARRMALAAGLVFLFLAFLSALSPIAVAHDLARGREASVGGDANDDLMFTAGWLERKRGENVTFYYPRDDRGTIWIPMPGGRAYDCLLRLDMLPDTSGSRQIVELRVNRRWTQRLTVRGDPNDVGRYRFRIPAGIVRSGLNRFDLIAPHGIRAEAGAAGVSAEPRFRFWYIRFFPQPR